jgi:hypothetical protein
VVSFNVYFQVKLRENIEKVQLFVPSLSFDAACILAAFDLPQLLIGSACLALRWRS